MTDPKGLHAEFDKLTKLSITERALREALSQVPAAGPTANIPAHTRALPMAHVMEHPLKAIDAALSESAAKKPSWGSLLVTLASPVVLCAKSLADLIKGVKLVNGVRVIEDPVSMAIALAALVVGGVAAGFLLQKWYSDQKPSKLHELATAHVAEWFEDMKKAKESAARET